MADQDATRKVTGSSDIPLSKEGEKQASQMASKYSQKFDYVFTSPEERSVETASYFGKPVVLKGLDAWYRGSHEGKPANVVKGAMRHLILHPNTKPPGVSPISKKPGESYLAFLRPLMAVMRVLKKEVPANKRALVVTSGGNLQAIDQLAKSGFPKIPDIKDLHKIAQSPYWTATGQLFKLTDKGLEKVDDNTDGNIHLIEHGATDFNPAGAPKSPNK
jgi:broad specificity phosphatase PhoE